MILDRENLVSLNQSVAQVIGSYLSTDSIDLGLNPTTPLGNTPISDPGRALHPQLLSQLTEDVTSGGAGTLEFQIISGSGVDGNGQINAGLQVEQSTGAIALAKLKKGYQARLALPAGISQRYLAARYVVAGATLTAGKVTTGIVFDKQTNPSVG